VDDAATVAVTNAFEHRAKPVGGTGNTVKMDPTNTTKAAMLTPARSIRLIAISIFKSASDAISQPSRRPAKDHLQAKRNNDDSEYGAEDRYADPHQETRAYQGAC
jgi:hypothetical protein